LGSVQAEAAHDFARGQPGQVFLFLFFASEFPNGKHDQRRLHRCRGADARIAAFEFLHNQPVGDIIQSGPTVFFRDKRPESTDFAQSFNEVHGELGFLGVFFDNGRYFAFDPLAGGIAHQFMLVGEEFVHQVIIGMFKEVLCHGLKDLIARIFANMEKNRRRANRLCGN